MKASTPTVYAIDFGTSNSLLAAANSEKTFASIELDPLGEDASVMRSVFLSPSKDQWHFGQEAIDIYREQSGQSRLFRSMKKFLPESGFEGTQVHGRFVSIIDLVSVFLKEMRKKANEHFETDVDSVVLGRPAAFSLNEEADQLAQKRLESAARMAGFKEIAFCPEPVAAAHDYRKQLQKESIVLIADFGGGTSDFSILKMGSGDIHHKDVLGLGGISLAGDAYDGSIMKHKINRHFGTDIQYKMPMGKNVLKFPKFLLSKLNSPADISFLARKDTANLLSKMQAWCLTERDQQKLKQLVWLAEEGLGYAIYKEIEHAKKELSNQEETTFKFEHFIGIDIQESITQKEFQSFSKDITDKIVGTLNNVLSQAGVKATEVDFVCLTGGTAQMKSLREAFRELFGQEKLKEFRFFHSIINGLAEFASLQERS